ncbi:MAG: iron-containing alcohol dehydrogenase [Phycisphaerae bacterium]
MIHGQNSIPDCLQHSPVRVIFGAGTESQLGPIVMEVGYRCVLVVTDPGIVAAGHVERATRSLKQAGAHYAVYDGARENPTTRHVAGGVTLARQHDIDAIIGLGGGSSMDCAKGINLILTNGGQIADYWGENKPQAPMLPMILIPATAGTGSEAQSFALISDPVTHQKMACGDRRLPTDGGLRPRVAILDPDLTLTQPPAVAAAAGIDAVAHAVETSATTRRNDMSREFSRLAWQLLDRSLPAALTHPTDARARAEVLLGAHLAGAAIEESMLGAAHACSNPLTARFGIAHGQAVGAMLPAVVRFNAGNGHNPYADLHDDAEQLAQRIEAILQTAGLQARLGKLNVPESALPELADLAAQQWTAGFNPRPVAAEELLGIYRLALD